MPSSPSLAGVDEDRGADVRAVMGGLLARRQRRARDAAGLLHALDASSAPPSLAGSPPGRWRPARSSPGWRRPSALAAARRSVADEQLRSRTLAADGRRRVGHRRRAPSRSSTRTLRSRSASPLSRTQQASASASDSAPSPRWKSMKAASRRSGRRPLGEARVEARARARATRSRSAASRISLLVLEVVVDQAGRQAGRAGDVGHRRAVVALLGHDLHQGADDLLAAFIGVRRAWHQLVPSKLVDQPRYSSAPASCQIYLSAGAIC